MHMYSLGSDCMRLTHRMIYYCCNVCVCCIGHADLYLSYYTPPPHEKNLLIGVIETLMSEVKRKNLGKKNQKKVLKIHKKHEKAEEKSCSAW